MAVRYMDREGVVVVRDAQSIAAELLHKHGDRAERECIQLEAAQVHDAAARSVREAARLIRRVDTAPFERLRWRRVWRSL